MEMDTVPATSAATPVADEGKEAASSPAKAKKSKKSSKKGGPAPPPPHEPVELQWKAGERKAVSVRVHVIEARELKGREDSGVSDPICFVSVGGKREKTKVMRKTLSCVWDHCFFFELEMTQSEFENGTVGLEVFDANAVRRNVLIGASHVDLATVWQARHQELYRQWVALQDTKEKFEGVQGFLRFSVAVVAEGQEWPPTHEDDDDGAVGDDDLDAADLQSLVLAGPNVELEEYYIIARVYRAEGLPRTDARKSDPYVRVRFGGRSYKTQVQKNTLDPEWNEELYVPASRPALSDRVEVLVYDWDLTDADDLVAARYFSFKSLVEAPLKLCWVPLYGVPGGDCGAAALEYNCGQREGTAYRGRVLLEIEARRARNARASSKNLAKAAAPEDDTYLLQVDAYEGDDLMGTSSTVIVECSVGASVLPEIRSKSAKRGTAKFFEQAEGQMRLPARMDLSEHGEAPDLLVSVYTKALIGSRQRIGYLRVPLRDLPGFATQEADAGPQWYTLRHDHYGCKYGEGQVPGALLLRFGFGLWAAAPDARPPLLDLTFQKFQLRAHVYQARQLAAADENGLADPYAEVRVHGATARTKTLMKTLNPAWYQTLTVDVTLPTPLRYAPDVSVLVYDWDRLSGNDLIGRLEFPLDRATAEMPRLPEWMPLYFEDPASVERPGGDGSGEILVSFQLIPYAQAQSVPQPPIAPETRSCFFEVAAVGLRSLVPMNLRAVGDPIIVFDTGSEETRTQTKQRAQVKGADADILETLQLSLPLPVEPVFAPTCNLRVYDRRVTGNVLVGTAAVPMGPYLPWGPEQQALSRRRAETEHMDRRRSELLQQQAGGGGAAAADDKKQKKKDKKKKKTKKRSKSKKRSKKSKKRSKKKKGKRKRKLSSASDSDSSSSSSSESDSESSSDSESDSDSDSDSSSDSSSDSGLDVRIDVGEPQYAGDGVVVQDIMFDEEKGSDASDYEEDEEDEEDEAAAAGPAQPVAQGELEEVLRDDLPFEEFKLYRGRTRGLNALSTLFGGGGGGGNKGGQAQEGTRTEAGLFKGRFRVIENARLRDAEDPLNLKQVFKPKDYFVRVYVLRGHSIVPHDDNGFSDPYLILDTGFEKTTKKDGALREKTTEPGFYAVYELKTRVPGPPLVIQCWDHDALSADDLIGETRIDLENRLFCKRWKEMQPKWVEFRTLWSDASRAPQGKLEMFVEIMTPSEAKRTPRINIEPPKAVPAELRLVIWETRNCVLLDEKKSDLFVSAQLEGMDRSERQETDTHWKSQDGTGSFNWRMKFPIDLPYKVPRLKIGIWDKDLVSADDVLCEATLDLTRYFKRAFKTGRENGMLMKGFEFNDRWLKCFHPNEPDVVQGEVRVTLELMSAEMAAQKPNGVGREEPNAFPFLDPPIRPDDSFNPLNPLSWAKYGGGKLFSAGKGLFGIAMAVGVLLVILKLAAVF